MKSVENKHCSLWSENIVTNVAVRVLGVVLSFHQVGELSSAGSQEAQEGGCHSAAAGSRLTRAWAWALTLVSASL